ncbi:hypothetical protein CERZMDRAFT_86651 [Cercospora zeae-maydis SCOH1-5]|uniref:RING-type domain-containing protein n=1 Tax=Cercospora zeae-maydis SCOH1-5 TaxID=717836 RepID=A0A6A6F722_9PEZI|nr:hypothetical protein CERZMDRAFT_86651 [Cercospora zeae-maydis SCOH1-5]
MEDIEFMDRLLRRRSHFDIYTHIRSKGHLSLGAHVSKDDILSIEQPTAELRTTLATTYWLQKALADLPLSSPSQAFLEERLCRESRSSLTTSTRSLPSPCETKGPGFVDIPQEVRAAIYKYCIFEPEPISPLLRHSVDFSSSIEAHFLSTGLPALAEVLPTLSNELSTMLPVFYRSNTFRFDVRDDDGVEALRRWIEENEEETSAARSISVRHWTWWRTPCGQWEHAADETVLSLLPTGLIRLTRRGGKFDPAVCNCDIEDFLYMHCPSWNLNKPWSVAEFVDALRQEGELLIQAVIKFVNFIQQQNDGFHEWRDSPKSCSSLEKHFSLSFTSRTRCLFSSIANLSPVALLRKVHPSLHTHQHQWHQRLPCNTIAKSFLFTQLKSATVEDDANRGICQEVFKEPVELPCGHIFCKVCFSIWLAGKKTCPLDRIVLFEANDEDHPEDDDDEFQVPSPEEFIENIRAREAKLVILQGRFRDLRRLSEKIHYSFFRLESKVPSPKLKSRRFLADAAEFLGRGTDSMDESQFPDNFLIDQARRIQYELAKNEFAWMFKGMLQLGQQSADEVLRELHLHELVGML